MTDIRRIMYATDFSPASLVALPRALDLARLTGAELTIVHVLTAPRALYIEGGYVPQEIWDRSRADAERELDRLIARAVDAGVRATASPLDGENPADAIVRAAADRKADVLVLGTHGRGGVARLVLGSVATRVVATAPCPVLTVRATAESEERT